MGKGGRGGLAIGRERVKSRKGWVGLPFPDTFWARLRHPVGGQRDTLFPPPSPALWELS